MATHTCSITHDLIVDPVIAEDGHVYEKKAITRWLANHSTSPKNNTPMGKGLVVSVSARQTIADLMETDGVVDDEAAAAWHFAMGVKAAAPPDNEGALEHFERAAELGHAGAQLQIEGIELNKKLEDFRRRATEEKQEISHLFSSVAGSTPAAHLSNAMTEWKDLDEGAIIRVLDDIDEVQRLCERAAPGADEAAGWDGGESMSGFCGRMYKVDSSDDDCKGYCLDAEDENFTFPFDACILVQE
jgi:hypothetical protein